MEKTQLTSNRTIIGLGTEHKDEYNRLVAAGHHHIIFTDRASVPNMKAVTRTRKLFQLEGDLRLVSDGEWSLHTFPLQCACPPY